MGRDQLKGFVQFLVIICKFSVGPRRGRRGQRKGATSKTSKGAKTTFDILEVFAQGKRRTKSSKSGQNNFDTLRKLRAAPIFWPLLFCVALKISGHCWHVARGNLCHVQVAMATC